MRAALVLLALALASSASAAPARDTLGAPDEASTGFRPSNDCQVPIDRYTICPRSKRRSVAYEVVIMSAAARRLFGARDPRQGPWVPFG